MPWTTISPWRPVAGTGQNITLGASSVAMANPVSANTLAVFVSATGNCHIRVGTGTPVALATDMLVKASDPPILIKVAPGEKVAAIQDGTSTGSVNIIEATH